MQTFQFYLVRRIQTYFHFQLPVLGLGKVNYEIDSYFEIQFFHL